MAAAQLKAPRSQSQPNPLAVENESLTLTLKSLRSQSQLLAAENESLRSQLAERAETIGHLEAQQLQEAQLHVAQQVQLTLTLALALALALAPTLALTLSRASMLPSSMQRRSGMRSWSSDVRSWSRVSGLRSRWRSSMQSSRCTNPNL